MGYWPFANNCLDGPDHKSGIIPGFQLDTNHAFINKTLCHSDLFHESYEGRGRFNANPTFQDGKAMAYFKQGVKAM